MQEQKKVITVFTRNRGFYSSFVEGRSQTLEGMIRFVSGQGSIPYAWAEEGTKEYGGEKMCSVLLRESEEAGRLIVSEGGEWVAKGLTEEKMEAGGNFKFRIGGIYRQNDGDYIHLTEKSSEDQGRGIMLTGRYKGSLSGARRLADGMYPRAVGNPNHPCHLIPGEIDAALLPADALLPKSTETPKAPAKTAASKKFTNPDQKSVAVTLGDGTVLTSTHPADLAMMANDTKNPKAIAVKAKKPKEEKLQEVRKTLPAIGGLLMVPNYLSR